MTDIFDRTPVADLMCQISTAFHRDRAALAPMSYITPAQLAERIAALTAEALRLEGEARALECAEIAASAMRLALDAREPRDIDGAPCPEPAPEPRFTSRRATARPDPVCVRRIVDADEQWIAFEEPAPRRLTPEMVDDEIADEDYHLFLPALTVCVLTLRNGYTVTGESACLNPAEFDAEIGRDLAKGKAREKVFALLAFRARDEIARARSYLDAAE